MIKYPIANMHDFRNGRCGHQCCICFGQLVSPLCLPEVWVASSLYCKRRNGDQPEA